ncbi:hypothetical protein DN389_13020 [Bacillus sp. AY3-1]|nr:hypothetical protein DN389_13020 [Bacillus sp. AY3-1]
MNNLQNKEMYISWFCVVNFLKLSGGLYILSKKGRLKPTNIHLPLKVAVFTLSRFEGEVLYRKTIKSY